MFQKLLRNIANELNKLRMPYIVIGGQAVLLYGEPRLTKDIDITLGVGIEGVEQIKDVVQKLALGMLVDNPDEFVKKTMVLPVMDDKTGISLAKTAIEEAKTKISEANSRGSDLTHTELLLEEAEQALEAGEQSVEKLKIVKLNLAVSPPMNISHSNPAFKLIAVAPLKIRVSSIIENRGNAAGDYDATLKTENGFVYHNSGTLNANENTTIGFEYILLNASEYDVSEIEGILARINELKSRKVEVKLSSSSGG